jgi:hypothetical protein
MVSDETLRIRAASVVKTKWSVFFSIYLRMMRQRRMRGLGAFLGVGEFAPNVVVRD